MNRSVPLVEATLCLLKQAWFLLRERPLVTCPACKGSCGSTDYWGEWDDCYECAPITPAEDWPLSLEWSDGRVDPFRWPWLWLAVKTGQRSFLRAGLCLVGLHVDDRKYPGVCSHCYEPLEERK